jgi:hypothetical protein
MQIVWQKCFQASTSSIYFLKKLEAEEREKVFLLESFYVFLMNLNFYLRKLFIWYLRVKTFNNIKRSISSAETFLYE